MEASGSAESVTIQLLVASCNQNPRAQVAETETEVHITIEADEGDGSDCADGLTVTLASPLGSRTVIDDNSGDVVEVEQSVR